MSRDSLYPTDVSLASGGRASTMRGAARQTVASSRSRLRTPASTVYSRLIDEARSSNFNPAAFARHRRIWQEMRTARNLRLFFLGIAGNLDDIHPVRQRPGIG